MRSVITGGAGFLGCHLAEKLVSLKHEVVVLDNFFVGRLDNLKNNLSHSYFFRNQINNILNKQ